MPLLLLPPLLLIMIWMMTLMKGARAAAAAADARTATAIRSYFRRGRTRLRPWRSPCSTMRSGSGAPYGSRTGS